MKYFVLGDRDMVLGFRLVGIEGIVVDNREDAGSEIKKLLSQKEYGIILVSEKVGKMIEVEKYNFTCDFPLIIDIPDRTGPVEDKITIEEIIKKAVGISI